MYFNVVSHVFEHLRLWIEILIRVYALDFKKFVAFKVERLTVNYVIVLLVCKNQSCDVNLLRSIQTNEPLWSTMGTNFT